MRAHFFVSSCAAKASLHAQGWTHRAAKSISTLHRHRLFFRFDVVADVMAPVQRLNMSLVALVIAVVDWRLASAAILPRAELATECAPLSHMLMNGFFFNQGFDIELLLRPCRGLHSVVSRIVRGPTRNAETVGDLPSYIVTEASGLRRGNLGSRCVGICAAGSNGVPRADRSIGCPGRTWLALVPALELFA
jgi:hypothetical protein